MSTNGGGGCNKFFLSFPLIRRTPTQVGAMAAKSTPITVRGERTRDLCAKSLNPGLCVSAAICHAHCVIFPSQVCKVDVSKPAWEQPTPVHNRWHPGMGRVCLDVCAISLRLKAETRVRTLGVQQS